MIEHDNTEPGSDEQTVITFLGFKADALNLVAIENTLDEFMNINQDIFITYEGIKGLPYYDALEGRQGAGTLDDIMMLDHDHILTLSREGLLEDLSELSTLDNYIPWAREQFTADDGSVYFIPTCISTYNLYINTDLLETHGQKLPENLGEFAQVCDYFVSQGITPVIANNYASLSTLILAKGMYPVYSSENSLEQIQLFNSGEADMAEQLRPGFELVKEMLERGWLDGEEVVATNQTSDDLAIFAEGERPFMVTGGWASPRLNVDFSYGVYPYPILDDGSVLAMSIDTCIGVCSYSEQLDETKKLVEFITQPDVMWEYCDSQSSYSPLTDDRVPSDKTIAPSAAYLSNGRSILRNDYDLTLPVESSLRECSNQMMLGMSVDDAQLLLSSLLYSETEAE